MKKNFRSILLGAETAHGMAAPCLQSLDPFVIDPLGIVINSENGKPADHLSLKTAVMNWNSNGPGSKYYEIDLSRPEMLGRRIPSKKTHQLLGESWTSWLVHDITPAPLYYCDVEGPLPKPKLAINPSRQLPASGDTAHGWIFVKIKKRFASIFHAPSLATHVFSDILST